MQTKTHIWTNKNNNKKFVCKKENEPYFTKFSMNWNEYVHDSSNIFTCIFAKKCREKLKKKKYHNEAFSICYTGLTQTENEKGRATEFKGRTPMSCHTSNIVCINKREQTDCDFHLDIALCTVYVCCRNIILKKQIVHFVSFAIVKRKKFLLIWWDCV